MLEISKEKEEEYGAAIFMLQLIKERRPLVYSLQCRAII